MMRLASDISSLCNEPCGFSLDINGSLPPGLTGTLFSVGPGRFDIDGNTVGHWLDGFSAVSSICIGDGTIQYAHRFVGSSWYKRALIDGRIPRGGFGDHGARVGRCSFNDNANMNLIPRPDGIELLNYSPFSVHVDPLTLLSQGTKARADFPRGMARHCIGCPHPFLDEQTGDRINVLLSRSDRPGYIVTTTEAGGRCNLVCRIPSARLGLVHSFSVTQHWIVIVESPFTARPRSINVQGGPSLGNFVWDAARGTRVFVINRSSGVVASMQEIRPLFILRHTNAWETADQIVLEVAAFGDPAILARLSLCRGKSSSGDLPTSLATRIFIDAGRLHATCVPLGCPPGDFYTIDRRFTKRCHRITFIAGPNKIGQSGGLWCRYDQEKGSVVSRTEDHCIPGPLVFVPVSAHSEEGVGWLLSTVFDAQQSRSFLLILDAMTMTETARAWLPHGVPCALQSVFVREGGDRNAQSYCSCRS